MAEATGAVEQVTSGDGTPISYRRSGSGPPLVLVHGAAAAHWRFDDLAPHLVERFTLVSLDRRGRGESGDADTYAIEREFEDVAAVVESLGGPVDLFGHSFGATVALGAAGLARALRRLVLYEPAPGVPAVPPEVVERTEELVARGADEEALVYAFESFGFTPDELAQIRTAPTWPGRVRAARTLPREIRAEEECRFDARALGRIAIPTLLLLGELSPGWARGGAERLAAALPDARLAVLPGQGHVAITTAPELVAAELVRFLHAPDGSLP